MQYYIDTSPKTIQRIINDEMTLIKLSMDHPKYVYPSSTERVFKAMHNLNNSIKKAAARAARRRPDNSKINRRHDSGSSVIDFMSRSTF